MSLKYEPASEHFCEVVVLKCCAGSGWGAPSECPPVRSRRKSSHSATAPSEGTSGGASGGVEKCSRRSLAQSKGAVAGTARRFSIVNREKKGPRSAALKASADRSRMTPFPILSVAPAEISEQLSTPSSSSPRARSSSLSRPISPPRAITGSATLSPALGVCLSTDERSTRRNCRVLARPGLLGPVTRVKKIAVGLDGIAADRVTRARPGQLPSDQHLVCASPRTRRNSRMPSHPTPGQVLSTATKCGSSPVCHLGGNPGANPWFL